MILTASFIQAFLVAKNIYLQHEALAKIQENARVIHYLLVETLTYQGSMGCNRIDDLNVQWDAKVDLQRWGGSPLKGLLIKQSGWPKLRREPVPDSDVLWINYTKKHYPLSAFKKEQKGDQAWRKINRWKPGRALILSNCRRLQIVMLPPDRLILEPVDPNTIQVAKLHSILLYVAATHRKDSDDEPIYALYTTDLNGRTHERVEGVEKIKLTHEPPFLKLEFLLVAGDRKQWWTWEM